MNKDNLRKIKQKLDEAIKNKEEQPKPKVIKKKKPKKKGKK